MLPSPTLQFSDSDETEVDESENIGSNEQQLNGAAEDDDVVAVQDETDYDSVQLRCLF